MSMWKSIVVPSLLLGVIAAITAHNVASMLHLRQLREGQRVLVPNQTQVAASTNGTFLFDGLRRRMPLLPP